MQEVRMNIKLEEKDFVNFGLMSFLGSITKNLGMVLMAGLFAYLVWNYSQNGNNFWLMVVAALPVLSYIATIVYFIPKNAKAEFAGSSYFGKTPLFALSKETLTVERESGNESVIRLSDLTAAWETGKYFYFFISKNNSLMIPKRILQPQDIMFIKEVFAKLPRKIRKNPFKVKPLQLIGTIFMLAFIIFAIVMIIWSFTNGIKAPA